MAKAEEKKINGGAAELEAVREAPTIPLDRFKLREMAHNSYLVQAPEGLEPKDLTKPHVYITAASQLLPFDLLWVVANDESWMAEVRVRHGEGSRVQAQVLRVVQLEPKDVNTSDALPAGHRLRLGNQAEGWLVEREDPQAPGTWQVMASGTNHHNWTRKEARAWLEEHASIRQPAPQKLGR